MSGRVVGHRVHREVATGQIFLQRGAVLDHRVSTVGHHVMTEGGYFVELAVAVEDADGAELDADGNRLLE